MYKDTPLKLEMRLLICGLTAIAHTFSYLWLNIEKKEKRAKTENPMNRRQESAYASGSGSRHYSQ